MSKEGFKYYVDNPKRLFYFFSSRGLLNWMPDELYLKTAFRIKMGYKLDLEHPKTFSEKLQWLKLHDRKEEYRLLVDKYDIKKYISDKIGSKYVVPAYGIWNSFDEIDFDSLPNRFVLKCTHDSGGLVICRDKKTLDYEKAKKKITRCLNRNYYWQGREWEYKDMKPRVLAEKYMEDESGCELRDYKVLCFHGEPRLIEYHAGRYTDHQTQDFYDLEWNKLPISQSGILKYKTSNEVAPKPETLSEMLDLSRELSKDFIHIRVDWYSVGGKLYFGELTFFDGSGLDPFDKYDDDLLIGSWIDLG